MHDENMGEFTMADTDQSNRPLSPHLTIYRPQLTSVSSILIRITGNALIFCVFLIIWWLFAAATSEQYFIFADAILTSWFGELVLLCSLWAIWYHFLGGVRHLIWDRAIGLDLKTAEIFGWIVVIGSFLFTILTVILL